MTENDANRTGTYGSSDESKTGFYQSDAGASFGFAPATEAASRSKKHGIAVGDTIILREIDYTITGIISEETGEAVIYKIADGDSRPFALKLYFEFGNAREEPSAETLRRIREINDPDILKLHEFGVGENKYLEKYCFEICDFAEGGDLFSVKDFRGKYTAAFVEKTIVPEIFKGICRLHAAKIYHCDLKPQNIFYLDANRTDAIIGDYGSAKAYDLEAVNTSRRTTVVKGTEAYLAPEQAIGIISETNDYYSFGLILLHLLYPESLADDADLKSVDRRKINRLKEAQYNFKPVIEFDSKLGRLNDLIAGLTLHNHQNRWGRKEVEQWTQGKSPEVRYEGGSVLPIKLGTATIRTDKDLIKFIESNPDSWYRDLILNAFETVKNWLDSYRDIPTRIVFDEMVQFYKPHGADFVKEAILRFFQPDRPAAAEFDLFDVYKSPDAAQSAADFIGKIDEIWKHSRLNTAAHLEKLSFYLFQLEFALRQRGEPLGSIYESLGVSAKSFDNYQTEIQDCIKPYDENFTFRLLIDIFYRFNPQRVFRDANNDSIATLEELGLFYAGNKEAFFDKSLVIEREKFLDKLGKGALKKLDYKDFVFEIFKEKAENQIELIGLSFSGGGPYKINYKFYKSLDKFLVARGIKRNFTSRSEQTECCELRRRFLEKFADAGESFIKEVCRRHNISKLSNENLTRIRENFQKDARDRFLYVNTSFLLPKKSIVNNKNYETVQTNYEGRKGSYQALKFTPKTIRELREAEEKTKTVFHWRGAALAGLLSFLLTVPLLAFLAYSWGWIPKQGARYITFNKPVKLDGASFAAGDYLEVGSENEFNTCLRAAGDGGEKCYPTAFGFSVMGQQGSTGIDKLGAIGYEFSQPRDVFKVTKTARLGNRSYPVGNLINLTKNSNDEFCFDVPGKTNKCFPRRSVCPKCDSIDDYGHAISGYQGKRLFTFNQNTTLDGLTVKSGTAWEAIRENSWGNCLRTPAGEKCYLTQFAINRFKQPDVPVAANFGTIGTRQSSITNFGYGLGGFFALAVAGLLFYGVSLLSKQIRLFTLRNEIRTLEFKN